VIAPAWTNNPAGDELASVQPARCDGLPIDLDGEWTPARRAEVAAAHPRGGGAATLLVDELDYHAREWKAARQRLCKVLPTEPSWSPAIGDAGRACLLGRRADLRRLRELRDAAAAELVGHVVALTPPSSCADVARLEPAARASSVEPVRLEHDAIALLRDRGLGGEALARAEALVASLPADAPPLAVAMANALLGEIQLAQVGLGESAGPMRTAFFAYRVAGSPQAFEPALHLVDAYSQAGELALADEWLAHARVEAQRVDISAANRAVLELMAARLRSQRGDPAGAVRASAAALRALDGTADPRRVVTMQSIRSSLSIFLAEDGRLADSIAVAREVVADREQLYGASHPILINDLFNIGLGELELGRHAAALATLTRAREIADASLPPGAVLRGYALWNEALALGRSDPRAARAVFDRALALIVAVQGETSSDAVQLRARGRRSADRRRRRSGRPRSRRCGRAARRPGPPRPPPHRGIRRWKSHSW
jgi:tetratricopeptide (TPR) repeat protein